jgi:hypothetical protein
MSDREISTIGMKQFHLLEMGKTAAVALSDIIRRTVTLTGSDPITVTSGSSVSHGC